MARVAVVEDDETVAESIAYSLRRVGHEVELFANGDVAMRRLEEMPPDLAVLDLTLAGATDGLEICKQLRRSHPRLPIIILTARGEEVDRVVGLESGADDYVVKPFSLRELEARVKALLRRSALSRDREPPPTLACGRFVLDRRSGRFLVDGAPLSLSPREQDLLAVLMEREGDVVARDDLLGRVWGEDYIGEVKTLDVHIRWLRMKLEADPSNPRHIVTVRGRGYRFHGD